MADALKRAAEAAGRSDSQVSNTVVPETRPALGGTHGISAVSGSGAAAAPATARETSPAENVVPSVAHETSVASTRTRSSAGGNRAGMIAVVVLVAAAGGYFGWTKFHTSVSSIPFLKQAISSVKPAAPPATAPSTVPEQSPVATHTSPQPSAEVVATPLPSVPDKNLVPAETVASTAKKPTSISIASSPEAPVDAVKTLSDDSHAIVVKNEAPRPVTPKSAPQEVADPAAPALNVASDSADKAISGLVDTPAPVPSAAAQSLKVSQGVSQGLLVKKVAPVYPQQAVQMHVQGAVQMLASISKDGNITGVKLISGDAVLARAAMDAVKQWKYKPYYLNGEPVEIQTQITVNFSLP
jgi:periplasmic protein TonB